MSKPTFLPAPIRGAVSLLMYGMNTILCTTPLFFMALLKWIIPIRAWRVLCSRVLNGLANIWISINNFNMRLTQRIHWDVSGLEVLKKNRWYLVVANHQSWADILVLQKVFHRKIPFLKFFLKKELIWVPILGQAWWALEFPFMKRYSESFLKKRPHLRGKDLETTRKACEKFKTTPISIMNFVEGTRFTPSKHRRQQSPFDRLLKPKAGGIAFVLGAMGDYLDHILNVTIVYPQGPKNFWGFVSGKVNEIKVRVEALPIPKEVLGDYHRDHEFRERFQAWVNDLWQDKDRCMTALMNGGGTILESAESARPS